MRISILAIPLSLLVASNVGAQSVNYPSSDDAPISTVQVTAPFLLSDSDAEMVAGQYALSNGWRLKMEQASNGMVARIDRNRPIKLIAVSADRFVSRDGNVTMDFNRGKYGDEMLMTYVPDQRVAITYVVTARLAQR
ncbi:MAG: hypothetical protein WCC39_18065 [Telluria sp.]